jgi:alanine dehydrogenase
MGKIPRKNKVTVMSTLSKTSLSRNPAPSLVIGIPRERKALEGRVVLTPAAVAELVRAGHTVHVEHDAGLQSGYDDAGYAAAGACMQPHGAALYAAAQLIVKVKEPVAEELAWLRADHVLFCFLHLAACPALTHELLRRRLTAYAFETLMQDGRLPLLAPMSRIAGRLAVQLGMHYLEQPQGGAGILLGGIAGSGRGRVLVLGAGNAGRAAVEMALALGAEVEVLDRMPAALEALRREWPSVQTGEVSEAALQAAIARADLLVGAVLLPGAEAPRVVTRALLESLRPGRVVVDIAIDQGGCIEGLRATDWKAPAYLENGHTYIGVTNLPGAVPRTATEALSAVVLPRVMELAAGQTGTTIWESALALSAGERRHPALRGAA